MLGFVDGMNPQIKRTIQGEKTMIPKRTVFISAVLTAFALATLGGVGVALKQSSATPATPTTAPVVEAATATPVALSPQDAATLAGNVLNQKDFYSVESASLNGTNAYKVTFSSGSVAFVGIDGQILSVSQIQPVVVAQSNAAPAPVFSAPAPAPAPSFSGGEHEGGGDD
jgi:hypothetical protein